MTEVTRVPIKPIAKGSLTKLWIGIVLAILIGAGIAWAAVPEGVSIETLAEGSGPNPEEGDVVFVKYIGKLDDGTIFDQSQEIPIPAEIFPQGTPFPFEEGGTVPGFYAALKQAQEGGKYLVEIPSELGYGAEQQPGSPIPPNSDLIFEIEVTGFMSRAEFEQRSAALQQMMMQMQQQQGVENAPAPAPPQ